MKKLTKLSVQWFYDLLEKGECDILDFKEQLEDNLLFGKSIKNFSASYDELARDVVAFANYKGGFLFVGIQDSSKEINQRFSYDNNKIFDLVKQIQNRTSPAITLLPHPVTVNGIKLLVLEIPFSPQMHRTSKGEYLIRSNNGNRSIEPYEMATIMSEKNMIVYDQKVWNVELVSRENDSFGNPLPGWQDKVRIDKLLRMIGAVRPDSPFLSQSIQKALSSLGLQKESDGHILPTTAGILFIGNDTALKELPFASISYNRYFDDGTYRHFEYSGNIIESVDACFAQLKAEIQQKEFHFGLFREYVEDYPEVVLRELLMNAVAHRDYSRPQIIQIRKYPTHIEIESPGPFPNGIDETNYLRQSNARNPNIMDVLREIGYTEKAGSGFNKIFTELLSKGKRIPVPEETQHSLTFIVEAEIISERLLELSAEYKRLKGKDVDIDALLVLNTILNKGKTSLSQLEGTPNISRYTLRHTLDELIELGFIETTGKASGVLYILHSSKQISAREKASYIKNKGFDDEYYRRLIIEFLRKFRSASREDIHRLLVDKLPGTLTPKQKFYKVGNLLASLRKSDQICTDENRRWHLAR